MRTRNRNFSDLYCSASTNCATAYRRIQSTDSSEGRILKVVDVVWLVLWLRQSFADLLRRMPGFPSVPPDVGYPVDRMALGQVLLGVLMFAPVTVVPPIPNAHLSTYRMHDNLLQLTASLNNTKRRDAEWKHIFGTCVSTVEWMTWLFLCMVTIYPS
jgi:hypothetical protein